MKVKFKFIYIIFFIYLFNSFFFGQNKLTLDQCINLAFNNNEQLKIANIESKYYKESKKASYEIPKTSFIYTQGQFNSIYNLDNNITVSQTIPFPTLLMAQSKLAKSYIAGAEIKISSVKADIGLQIKDLYYNLQHSLQEIILFQKEDSIYDLFLKLEDSRNELSKKSTLEKSTTISESYLIKSLISNAQMQINTFKIKLKTMMRTKELPDIYILSDDSRLLKLDTNLFISSSHPFLLYLKEQINLCVQKKNVEVQKWFPDIMFSYFNQSIYGPANIYGTDYFLTRANRLQGFQVGFNIPLFFKPHLSKVKAAGLSIEVATEEYHKNLKDMEGDYKVLVNEYIMTNKNIDYYSKNILKNAKEMSFQSLEAYNNKEINYIEYLSIISKSFEIERNYLNLILENNQAVLKLEYFLNK
jgi:cobalt-zinc-cadmium resistance protein CzcA